MTIGIRKEPSEEVKTYVSKIKFRPSATETRLNFIILRSFYRVLLSLILLLISFGCIFISFEMYSESNSLIKEGKKTSAFVLDYEIRKTRKRISKRRRSLVDVCYLTVSFMPLESNKFRARKKSINCGIQRTMRDKTHPLTMDPTKIKFVDVLYVPGVYNLWRLDSPDLIEKLKVDREETRILLYLGLLVLFLTLIWIFVWVNSILRNFKLRNEGEEVDGIIEKFHEIGSSRRYKVRYSFQGRDGQTIKGKSMVMGKFIENLKVNGAIKIVYYKDKSINEAEMALPPKK